MVPNVFLLSYSVTFKQSRHLQELAGGTRKKRMKTFKLLSMVAMLVATAILGASDLHSAESEKEGSASAALEA